MTIPAGSTQTSFYYGDSAVGTPRITASGSGLASATQVESIGPVVSAIQPQQGPITGNTQVTINGSGFNSSSAVLFGTKPATSTTYVSTTQLQAVSPPASAGVVDVMVITNGAQDMPSAVDRFVYGSVSNYRGVSAQQYSLSGSNGSTWSAVDASKLTLTVVTPATSYAVLTATASLFASTASVNQDLGITVSPSPGGCAQSPVVWKESGGAIGLRPNPVSMEIACTFQQGTTYTVQLVWKSNINTGATIYAGAGSGPYSPTVISASLTPASGQLVQANTSTNQYATSSQSWTEVNHSSLTTTVTFASATTARLSAAADLFVSPAGPNADLGICVAAGAPSSCSNAVAWQEAGGSGSFQPMASAVQTIYGFSAGTYTVGVVWKASAAGTIYAGAGPVSGQYSPTVLLINAATSPAQASVTTQIARQYNSPNNGTSWQDMDSTNLSLTLIPSQDSLAYLSANADLFTTTTAFNADLGICIYSAPASGCDPVGSSIAAWTESGTGATFNPDANLVQIPVSVSAGKTYTVRLQWRTNSSMPSNTTMYSGAGSGPYSPASLTSWLVPCPCPALAGGTQLVMTTPPLTGAPSSPAIANIGPVRVALLDARGAAVAAGTGGVTLNLSTTSSGGLFATSSGGGSITSVTIPAGLTGTTFYYGDLAAGTPTITATAAPALGLAAATQTENVSPTFAGWYYRGMSTQQYGLSGSNGSTWSALDASKLTLTVVPPATSYAVLSASGSLFTNTAGVNQDLGITVSPNPTGCTQSLAVWKESGGATAFRPNPVSMETMCTFQQGTTYTVQLVWKSNINTAATIYAGAGSGPYSPTVILASLTPTSGQLVQVNSSTNQYATSSQSWTEVNHSNLTATVTFSSTTTARLSAAADLFVTTAGPNPDLGICVAAGTPSSCTSAVAWQEAGGSSSFQPLASAVQTIYNFAAGTYTVGVVWKASATGTIYAGAGANPGPYSPTVLLINTAFSPATNPPQASITTQVARQYNSPNNGTSWQDMDSSNLSLSFTPTQDSLAYLSANASLFTTSTSFNADLGICIYAAPAPACDPAGSSIVAWTESGTGATFNPDANLMQIPVPVSVGKTYTVRLQWRTNLAMPSSTTLYSGAGSNPYSPTSLSAWLVPLSTCSST